MSKFGISWGKLNWEKLVISVLVLAIVIAALARHSCPSASEQANAITDEYVDKLVQNIKRKDMLREMLKHPDPLDPAWVEAKVNAIIASFDPATQAYLRGIPRENRIEAIVLEIQKEQDALVVEYKAREPHFWCR